MMVFALSSEARSTLVQDQVTKGQILKLPNLDKKGMNQDQYLVRNPIVSFVFARDYYKSQKMHLNTNVINLHGFWGEKLPILGLKLTNWWITEWYRLEIVYITRLIPGRCLTYIVFIILKILDWKAQ